MATAPPQVRRKEIKPQWVLSATASWSGAPLAERLTYAGSGKHKTYWPSPGCGDWTPIWIDDGETERCDKFDPASWPELGRLLKDAISGGFVSADRNGQPLLHADGFPARAWAWIDDVLHEARYSQNGRYHAFPLTRRECWPRDPYDRLASAPRWRR